MRARRAKRPGKGKASNTCKVPWYCCVFAPRWVALRIIVTGACGVRFFSSQQSGFALLHQTRRASQCDGGATPQSEPQGEEHGWIGNVRAQRGSWMCFPWGRLGGPWSFGRLAQEVPRQYLYGQSVGCLGSSAGDWNDGSPAAVQGKARQGKVRWWRRADGATAELSCINPMRLRAPPSPPERVVRCSALEKWRREDARLPEQHSSCC
ncbi:hypothetical protein V8C44DRAFT_82555 [Trichoderma aethiopicum]